jgi:hypothetical protein
MSSFKAWFVVGILRFQKWLLSFVVDIFAFFDLATFWPIF